MIKFRLVSVASASTLADYYTHDQEIEPHLRQDVTSGLYNRMGLKAVLVQTRAFRDRYQYSISNDELINIIDGKRADGGSIGRRITKDYVNSDGEFFQQKEIYDITIGFDKSFAIALANSATPENAQVILNVVCNAADEAMTDFEKRFAVARTQSGNVKTQERGQIFWLSFVHHTTRPDKDGNVSPHLHIHYLVPNAVFLKDGRVRSLYARQFIYRTRETTRVLYQALERGCREAGLRTIPNERTNGGPMLADVPNSLREFYSGRNRDIMRNAREYAQSRGEDFDTLPLRQRRAYQHKAALYTQGARRDGAPQLALWRVQMERQGWPARDLVGPRLPSPAPTPGSTPEPSLSLVQRLHRLRQEAGQRLALARHAIASAASHAIPLPGLRAPLHAPSLNHDPFQRMQSLRQSMKIMHASLKNSLESVSQRLHIAGVMRQTPELIARMEKMLATLATRTQPDATERLVRVYARKVSAGEMSLSSAVNTFVYAEERAVKPVGFDPVHKFPLYAPDAPTAGNRFQRETKWQNRIIATIDKIEAGTAWDDAAPSKMVPVIRSRAYPSPADPVPSADRQAPRLRMVR